MSSSGYIIVTLQFWREGDQWLGRCRELTTSTCGDSIEEAEEALREAVVLHLNALEDLGERKRFFRENHIRVFRQKPAQAGSRAVLPLNKEILTQKQILPLMAA